MGTRSLREWKTGLLLAVLLHAVPVGTMGAGNRVQGGDGMPLAKNALRWVTGLVVNGPRLNTRHLPPAAQMGLRG